MDIVDRLLSRIKVNAAGCFEWQGGRNKTGYGVISYCGEQRAHRVSYLIFRGPVAGKLVCHSCDNRACCNPSHLFLGTYKENMEDAVAKGRTAKGELNGSARLTKCDVIAIRGSSLSYSRLAKIFGVTKKTICFIKQRKTWRHVA